MLAERRDMAENVEGSKGLGDSNDGGPLAREAERPAP